MTPLPRFWPSPIPAVCRGANSNGDPDSIASITGGISGARLGFDAIPADWRERIEKADYLNDLSVRLVEQKASL